MPHHLSGYIAAMTDTERAAITDRTEAYIEASRVLYPALKSMPVADLGQLETDLRFFLFHVRRYLLRRGYGIADLEHLVEQNEPGWHLTWQTRRRGEH